MELYDWAWPRQVCYGKINIMEGLTLLSLSRGDRCVYYWTGYITQTRRHALQCARTFRATLYVYGMQTCTHTHTHTHKEHIKKGIHNTHAAAAEISTHAHKQSISSVQRTIPPHTLSFSLSLLWLCLYVCVSVPASESLNALMTTILTQVFWLLPLSIGTLTDMRLVTPWWKTREAHAVTMKRD